MESNFSRISLRHCQGEKKTSELIHSLPEALTLKAEIRLHSMNLTFLLLRTLGVLTIFTLMGRNALNLGRVTWGKMKGNNLTHLKWGKRRRKEREKNRALIKYKPRRSPQ